MLMRLVRPVKRSGSSVAQFVQRIPTDVRARAIGETVQIAFGAERVSVRITAAMTSIRFSLRTKDPAQIKVRQAEACAALEIFWSSLRQTQPISLPHKQCVALAGELYRAWADTNERTTAVTFTPGVGWMPELVSPNEEAVYFREQTTRLEALAHDAESADLERLLGPIIDRLLHRKGVGSVDPQTRAMLLEASLIALKDSLAFRARSAGGDYTPDPKAGRFPEWQSANPQGQPVGQGAVTLTGLLASWWREAEAAGRKPSTHQSYRNTIDGFVRFLQHDDAQRVTPEDVVRFKDFRLRTPSAKTGRVSTAKTVKDSDIAGLKTVFGWAVANRKLTANPADGITIKVGKRPKLRSKGFTDAEARALLLASQGYVGKNERPCTAAAKRWVPWLCAYTGARVGEVAQLRRQDVRQEGGYWLIHITPDAGTVKNNEARDVVLHEHLLAMGFVEFVRAANQGHLFLSPGIGDVRGRLQGLKNRLAEWGRTIVPDKNVAPNHGWRHRFKTVGMQAGIAPRILDAIQGHAPRSVAEGYGEVTLTTMADAIRKIPKVLE